MTYERDSIPVWKAGLVSVLAAFSIFTLFGTVKIINPGEVGVVTNLGKLQQDTLGEGLHFTFPYVTSVYKLSLRPVVEQDIQAASSSSDLQTLNAKATVVWQMNSDTQSVQDVYRRFGNQDAFEAKIKTILDGFFQEAIKATTTGSDIKTNLTHRQDVASTIKQKLVANIGGYPVNIVSVTLNDFDASPQYNKAIEDAQVAVQRNIQAQNQAKADITTAQAAQQVQQLKTSTLSTKLLTQQLIEKWDGKYPQVVLGSNTNTLLQLPAVNTEETKTK